MISTRTRAAIVLLAGLTATSVTAVEAASAAAVPAQVVAKIGQKSRAKPTTTSAVTGSYQRGARVAVDCKANGQNVNGNAVWYKLSSGKGWLSARYTKNLAPVPLCDTDDNTGKVGPPGPPGPKGPKGDKGDEGKPGAQGGKGDRGDDGDPGKPGAKGDKGETGAAGPTGPKGDGGAKGDQGVPGVQGPKGDKGEPGKDGASVTGAKGDPGTPGAKGDKGDKGDPGTPGARGAKGDRGEDGADAPRGVDSVFGMNQDFTVPAGAVNERYEGPVCPEHSRATSGSVKIVDKSKAYAAGGELIGPSNDKNQYIGYVTNPDSTPVSVRVLTYCTYSHKA